MKKISFFFISLIAGQTVFAFTLGDLGYPASASLNVRGSDYARNIRGHFSPEYIKVLESPENMVHIRSGLRLIGLTYDDCRVVEDKLYLGVGEVGSCIEDGCAPINVADLVEVSYVPNGDLGRTVLFSKIQKETERDIVEVRSAYAASVDNLDEMSPSSGVLDHESLLSQIFANSPKYPEDFDHDELFGGGGLDSNDGFDAAQVDLLTQKLLDAEPTMIAKKRSLKERIKEAIFFWRGKKEKAPNCIPFLIS